MALTSDRRTINISAERLLQADREYSTAATTRVGPPAWLAVRPSVEVMLAGQPTSCDDD